MKPAIFDYMDVVHFLRDYYRSRKESDEKFSYTAWSDELQLTGKTLLRMILQGKRQITAKTRENLKLSFAFDAHEANYFEALVDYSQAPSASQKQTAGQRLIQLQRQRFARQQVDASVEITHDAYGPIVLTAISSSPRALTAQELTEKLGLSQERIAKITEELCSSGLIRIDQGKLIASQDTFKIADHFGNQHLRNFHIYWHNQAEAALNLPKDVRRFRSLQVLLTPEEYEGICKEVNDFALSVLSRVEKNTLPNRRLYLVNASLFPVTKTM